MGFGGAADKPDSHHQPEKKPGIGINRFHKFSFLKPIETPSPINFKIYLLNKINVAIDFLNVVQSGCACCH